MKFLASRRWRIFLIVWIVYSVHFATNIVREHYPAFSLVDHGTFLVDEWQGFHSDIFVHRSGHSVMGNQVFVSTLAAIPLFIFDPVLDALEDYSKAKIAKEGVTDAEYRTDKPMRRDFFRMVKDRGLDLRFGGVAVVTTVFFMAPLTALFLSFFYRILTSRGVTPRDATSLTFLFAFGTPLFFRATVLGNNMFVMYGMFASFALLWRRPGENFPVPLRRRLLAGLFGGMALASDYIGVIILPLLYAYLFLPRLSTASWQQSFRESLAMVAGALAPVSFLLYSQWAMYGNPFLPGQYWMPNQNVYVEVGARGFTWPAVDLMLQNLFHPGFGMYVWGPVLLLALVPTWRYASSSLILPRRERRFVAAAFIAFLLFCSANQYARLQWNTGFRYLLPLVPFLILALSDHWVRLPRWVRMSVMTFATLHAWVLVVFREPVTKSWELFLSEGVRLPWYRVLSMTANPDQRWVGSWVVPTVILLFTVAAVAWIWRYGARLEEA